MKGNSESKGIEAGKHVSCLEDRKGPAGLEWRYSLSRRGRIETGRSIHREP